MSGTATYKLRNDLVIRRRVFGDHTQFVVKDPVRLEYWTIDQVAFTLLSLCDGKRDLLQLTEAANNLLPNLGLNALALRQFYEAYRGFNFFEDTWERNIMLIEKRRTSRAETLKKATANPVEIHFPAVNPDRFFNRIIGSIGFLFSGKAAVVYALLALSAFLIAASRLDEFLLPLSQLYVIPGRAITGLVILWICLLGSVILHELGHGLTCKYYGGGVFKMGFLLLYFNPCLFCDVTESFLFKKKSHKYAVTLAGGVVNVVIASVAVFVWFLTAEDLLINSVAQRVAIYNAFIGLVVNFNPLLKYDGYYVLSDFVDISNLQGDSFKFLGTRMRRLFKLPHEPELHTPRERRIFWIYGLFSISYVCFVLWFVYMLLGGWLISAYQGVGYLLAGTLLYLMSKRYLRSAIRFVRFLYLDKAGHFKAFRLLYLAGAAGLVLVFLFVPFPRHVRADFVLRPGEEAVVRAEEAGFIEAVLVAEGDTVAAGKELFVLQRDEIFLAQQQAAALTTRAEIEEKAALAAQDRTTAASHHADAAASRAQERYHDGRQARTAPKAPFAGVVMTPRVEETVGRGVEPGDALCKIGDLSVLRAEILLDEQLLGIVETDQPVELRLQSLAGGMVMGTIERVAPESSDGEVRNRYRLLVRVDNADGNLRPGMTGRARFDAGWVPALDRLNHNIARILRVDFWI